MDTVFADTGYWIALLYPQDALHQKSLEKAEELQSIPIVTHELVLSELLDAFSGKGNFMRASVANFIRNLRDDPYINIYTVTEELFEAGLLFYEMSSDKQWSHVDCVSFALMKRTKITNALAYDHHFQQAGFIALLRY